MFCHDNLSIQSFLKHKRNIFLMILVVENNQIDKDLLSLHEKPIKLNLSQLKIKIIFLMFVNTVLLMKQSSIKYSY